MSKVLVTSSYLTNIANAIRSKLGVSTTYTPSQMASAINSIPSISGAAKGTFTQSSTISSGTKNITTKAVIGFEPRFFCIIKNTPSTNQNMMYFSSWFRLSLTGTAAAYYTVRKSTNSSTYGSSDITASTMSAAYDNAGVAGYITYNPYNGQMYFKASSTIQLEQGDYTWIAVA